MIKLYMPIFSYSMRDFGGPPDAAVKISRHLTVRKFHIHPGTGNFTLRNGACEISDTLWRFSKAG